MHRSMERLEIKGVIDWVASRKLGSNICIAFHRNADPDAIASAVGVRELFNSVNPLVKVHVIAPEGINLLSKALLTRLGLKKMVSDSKDVSICNYFVIVDTSTLSQLGDLSKSVMGKEYVVIDHHEVNGLVNNAVKALYDPYRPSASELIIKLLSHKGVKPFNKVLTLLIAGILYDTKFLRLADEHTLESVLWAMKLGGDYFEAQSILSSKEIGRSEKIAVLKGLTRAGLYMLGKEWLLAITCIGSNESLVLKSLIEAGADIALAIAKRKEHNRAIVRVSKKFLNLVDPSIAVEITTYLGESLGGEGGGHGGAAGALIDAKVTGEDILKALRKFFKGKGIGMKVLEEGRWLRECE